MSDKNNGTFNPVVLTEAYCCNQIEEAFRDDGTVFCCSVISGPIPLFSNC